MKTIEQRLFQGNSVIVGSKMYLYSIVILSHVNYNVMEKEDVSKLFEI